MASQNKYYQLALSMLKANQNTTYEDLKKKAKSFKWGVPHQLVYGRAKDNLGLSQRKIRKADAKAVAAKARKARRSWTLKRDPGSPTMGLKDGKSAMMQMTLSELGDLVSKYNNLMAKLREITEAE